VMVIGSSLVAQQLRDGRYPAFCKSFKGRLNKNWIFFRKLAVKVG
jgi:hypothetical protein